MFSGKGTRRISVLTVIGTTLVGLLALLGLSAANAAPPYTTEATITSMKFTQESATTWSRAELVGTWSLPDNPAPTAGLEVELPEGLRGVKTSFPMMSDAKGTTPSVQMGTCYVEDTRLFCDIDDDYIAENPLNLRGTFKFWVQVTTETTTDTQVTYTFDDVEATLTVVPPKTGGTCPENCEFTGRGNGKWGGWDYETNAIVWTVAVEAGPNGAEGGETIIVKDTPGAGQDLIPARSAVVFETNEVRPNSAGYWRPTNWQVKPESEYTINAARDQVTIVAEKGYFYEIKFVTQPTDLTLETYENEATVMVGTEEEKTVTAQQRNVGGSATGIGENVGRFAVTKTVDGPDVNVDDVDFSVTYTVTPPEGEGEPVTDTFTFKAGQTWTSEDFPRNSTVKLSEATPSALPNASWGTPVFSESEFTLKGGTLSEITLTNPLALKTGQFEVSKLLAGDAASKVPADTTFTIDYSFPAGDGFEAGSGSLEVKAGEKATSPELPAGAVVSISEKTPVAITGTVWGDIVIDNVNFTVAAGDTTDVVVTNTINDVPTPSPSPSPTPSPSRPPVKPGLPSTGR